jgi:hypothetical protein
VVAQAAHQTTLAVVVLVDFDAPLQQQAAVDL